MFIENEASVQGLGKISLDHHVRGVLNSKTGDLAVQDNPSVVLSRWDILSQSIFPPAL